MSENLPKLDMSVVSLKQEDGQLQIDKGEALALLPSVTGVLNYVAEQILENDNDGSGDTIDTANFLKLELSDDKNPPDASRLGERGVIFQEHHTFDDGEVTRTVTWGGSGDVDVKLVVARTGELGGGLYRKLTYNPETGGVVVNLEGLE